MRETDDHELLAQCVRNRSELAFAARVRRHVNLVYSAALFQDLVATALKPEAMGEDINRFTSVALDLAEIPEGREITIPILSRLGDHRDASPAEFAERILGRLEALAQGSVPAP